METIQEEVVSPPVIPEGKMDILLETTLNIGLPNSLYSSLHLGPMNHYPDTLCLIIMRLYVRSLALQLTFLQNGIGIPQTHPHFVPCLFFLSLYRKQQQPTCFPLQPFSSRCPRQRSKQFRTPAPSPSRGRAPSPSPRAVIPPSPPAPLPGTRRPRPSTSRRSPPPRRPRS